MENKRSNDNQKGAALIFVLCILCVFMALGLSMIFMAFQVLSGAQRSGAREQAKITSMTYNESLKKEITEGTVDGNVTGKATNIREFLRKYVNDENNSKWPYFEEGSTSPLHSNRAEVTRTINTEFTGTGTTDQMGTVTVSMYWEKEGNTLDGATLTTIVTTTFRKETYKTKTQYNLAISGDSWRWNVYLNG